MCIRDRPGSVLIVAPKRVASTVWRQEAEEWGLFDIAEKMIVVEAVSYTHLYGLILYRDKLPKFRNKGKMIFNIIDWPRDNESPKIHPTQKPVKLLEFLIETFTDEGDVVIDPVEMCIRDRSNTPSTYITPPVIADAAVKGKACLLYTSRCV